MDREETTRNRLARCHGCQCPHVGPDGKCPGSEGLGCFGDWRCYTEYKAVCEKCTKTASPLYCNDAECQDMEAFRAVHAQ